MIAFVGLTHLGIVYSVATAAKGFPVICFDAEESIKPLRDGRLPIVEPGLDELFSAHRARIDFTSQLAALGKAEVVFFSLDVPTDHHNQSNLQPLCESLARVLPHLPARATLVILSQVPPGFTRAMASHFEEQQSQQLALFYQVETLVFGNAVQRALSPERYIVGCRQPEEGLPEPYRHWLETFACPILKMRYESAELTKIAINLFLVSSVSTTNLLAELCEQIGADWLEMAPALKLDRRIGPHAYLAPGLGLAGGNLERDLVTVQDLARQMGTEAGVVAAWTADSEYRRDWVLRKVHQLVLGLVENPVLAIWGLAYKAHTHSTRNSPSIAVIQALASFRKKAFDPQVRQTIPETVVYENAFSALEACEGADALLIMTPWPEFSKVPAVAVRSALRGDVVIDPFGILDAISFINAGFSYYRLGSSPKVYHD